MAWGLSLSLDRPALLAVRGLAGMRGGPVALALTMWLSSLSAVAQAEDDASFDDEPTFNSYLQPSGAAHNPDPWEGMNRKIFAFNDAADRWFLKPIAQGYQTITPDPVENGVSNLFANLFEVTTIVNDLLQFKLAQAASDTGRFLVNSTVGLLGLFDVASHIGLEKHNEDFGQTLGYWGVGSGPYVVVPLLGSYTLRSGAGGITESQTTAFSQYVDHVPTRNQLLFAQVIDKRAGLLSAEELITGDRYSFIRDAYLQQREYLTRDGKVEDSFGEEDFDEEWDELP